MTVLVTVLVKLVIDDESWVVDVFFSALCVCVCACVCVHVCVWQMLSRF